MTNALVTLAGRRDPRRPPRFRRPRLLLWVVLLSSMARADPYSVDVRISGEAGAVGPAGNPEITMLSERVDFFEPPLVGDAAGRWTVEGTAWTVRAHYVFRSGSRQPRDVRMIFPVGAARHLEYDEDLAEEVLVREDRPAIEDGAFTVRANGAELPTELRRFECETGPCYEFGWEFRVPFAPRGTVELDCEYRQEPATIEASDEWHTTRHTVVPFILRTGASWRGTIGSIELVYHLAVPADRFGIWAELPGGIPADPDVVYPWKTPFEEADVPLWDPPANFRLEVVCADSRTTVRLAARDVEPAGDVWFDVPALSERVGFVEDRGCDAWSGWNAPAQDCCSFLGGPTRLERHGILPPAEEPDE